MNEKNKDIVITTIRFTDAEIKNYVKLKIWALRNRVSMAEAIKRAIALFLKDQPTE